MKKILFLLATAMLTVTGVNAQSETKHEIAVSYGWLSNSDWLNIFENVVDAAFGETYEDNLFFGPVNLEYFYHFEPWFGVGAMAAYGQLSQDIIKNSSKENIGTLDNRYITFMPAVKFDWLRRDIVGLYSKLGAGVTWRSEKRNYTNGTTADATDKSDLHVNWHVSVIGVEIGKQLRGYAEYGLGEQGMLQMGIRYRF